jgi:hypothetical protein
MSVATVAAKRRSSSGKRRATAITPRYGERNRNVVSIAAAAQPSSAVSPGSTRPIAAVPLAITSNFSAGPAEEKRKSFHFPCGKRDPVHPDLDHLGTHRSCLELSSALLPVGDRSIMPGTAATVSATASSPDPVGSGIVESLSLTGFTNHEYSIGPKWLEFLKQIAPAVRRVGILRDPTNAAEIGGMLGAKARGLLRMLRVAAIPNQWLQTGIRGSRNCACG